MNLTFRLHKAFTLIELMITVAIILIMTIVAIPSMAHYITQSKVSDAILATHVVQNAIANKIAANKSVTNSGIGLTLPTNLSRYVASYSVSSDGVISITTSSSAKSIDLTITPTFNTSLSQVSWTCAIADANFNDDVPSECRI